MEGTVRTLDDDVRRRAATLMRQILAGVTSAHGAQFDLDYRTGLPVTFNDPALVEESLPTLRRVLGEANVYSPAPQMGTEDFSLYQKVIPGFFFFLGVRNQAKGITAMLHSPEFDVDEGSLVVGVKAMASVVHDYLERHSAVQQ